MKRLLIYSLLVCVFMSLLSASSCGDHERKAAVKITKPKVQNVILLVVDGPRYSETWGDPTHVNVLRLAGNLASSGCIYTDFNNDGPTYTNAGHTAITTGLYQEIDNTGQQLPEYASFLQYYLDATSNPSTDAVIISSKAKINVLGSCNDPEWKGRSEPETYCGLADLSIMNRDDAATFDRALEILENDHPHVAVICLKDPDVMGHAADYNGYIEAIKQSDQYAYELEQFLRKDTFYSGTTAFFITNDHGRHLDDVYDGFVSHGCPCEGCRHINLYASGPTIQQGVEFDIHRSQIDLCATIAFLLDIEMPNCDGDVMTELFQE